MSSRDFPRSNRTPPPMPMSHDHLIASLVIDADPVFADQLATRLQALGHEVTITPGVDQALEELRRRQISLIFLALKEPHSPGLEALITQEPTAPVVVLATTDSAAAATEILQRGATDYLLKSGDFSFFHKAVKRALDLRRAQIEEASTQDWLRREFVWRGAALERERNAMEQISVAVLDVLINALEAKDPYLRGHSARVADLSAMVAAELHCSDQQVEAIRIAGRLHDIGKIGITESIFNKQGPLTDDEYQQIKEHVTIGARILAPLSNLGDILGMVLHHHERFDGTGYPDGLSGQDIPLGARILGVAEVYDALTTARPYQGKMTPEQAADRMRDLVGTVLDPEVHLALTKAIDKRKALVFLDPSEII